ncbi:hypothetical protein SUGI_0680350 [Cryptomeria japonica]|nr:hypothetical protein SUGI_0680350 [Cryptomeria japonica]
MKGGRNAVQKGIDFVNSQTSLSLDGRGYGNQPSGFVILFSSLLKEANALGLGISNELPFIKRILAIREAQLKEVDMGILYNLPTSLLLSLEGLQEETKYFWNSLTLLSQFVETTYLVFILLISMNAFLPSILLNVWELVAISKRKSNMHWIIFWTNRGIGSGRNDTIVNVNDTAMGFRILRLHGYDVSAEVLKIFKNEKGEFFSFADKKHRGVEDMLNGLRFEIWIPSEFAQTRGKILIEGLWLSNKTSLAKTFYRLPYMNNEKYLELAKLDFNAVQSIHQKELQQVHKWWIESGFRELKFTRERHIETYFVVAAGMFEPEYGDCRIATIKVGGLIVVLDDLYDIYSSYEEIMLFNKAF